MKKARVSRRTFLGVVGAAPVAATLVPGLGSKATAATPSNGSGKLRFGCMVTFEDWAVSAGTWGEIGAYYILLRLRDAGFKRVFWRTSGCGQASYPTKVATPISMFQPFDPVRYPEHLERPYYKNYKGVDDTYTPAPFYGTNNVLGRQILDFSDFDSMRTARDLARKMGLEFWIWHEHAEDHGSIGQIGRMGLRHPEWFTVNRDGKRSRCRFSFAIQPAVEYRLSWVRELLEYEPDGIMFDFVKSMEGTPGVGVTPHFDDNGVWYCGYEAACAEAFRKKTGRDPFQIPNGDEEWIRFRASYLTDFVRRVREMQQVTYPKVKIGLFGCPRGRAGLGASDKPVLLADPLRAYLEDHEVWTREGLFDEFVNAYARHGSVGLSDPVRKKLGAVESPEEIKATIKDSRARIHPPCHYGGTQIEVYNRKDEKSLLEAVQAVAEAGCEEAVFFESTPLQWHNTWNATHKAIRLFGA